MMNILHWRLLVAVADARNISHAAEEIGMTQSGASQAIAKLEDSLGFPVFTRERRNIGVTALGKQVVEHARNMLLELKAIRSLAEESREFTRGRIRLASFPSVSFTFLPGLLRDLKSLHPGIEVVILEGTDDEVEEWLAAGTVELGVVMNPSPDRAGVVLGKDAWVAVMPARSPLAGYARTYGITLQQLVNQPFILATGGCSVNGQSLMENAGLQLTDVRVKVRDWVSACLLAGEGVGTALVPESALPEELRGLYVVPLTPSLYREFALVCSPSANASAAVQALLKSVGKRDLLP